jgi:hypothetical protein
VFEIKNTGTVTAPFYGGAPTTLVSFGLSIGEYPQGLIVDANGDLFGTTQTGGPGGFYNGFPQQQAGTVFEIQNTGTVAAPIYASNPTTLVSFDGLNGAQPLAGLTADATGNLFGTTYGGYANGGTVFEITDASGFTVTPPPTISGTIGGQTTTMEAPVTPFKGVTIGAANVGATDTLTITLGGAGGTLSGTGLSGGFGGVYTLSGTAAAITSELDALVFTPKAGSPNTSSTTAFTLSDQSSAYGTPTTDSTTTVTDVDPPIAPIIEGTVSAQTTTKEVRVTPFKGVTIGDSNTGATDTLTITLGDAGGTLSGTGLSGGSGVYTLSGTAAVVTSELDALVFTPTAGAPNTTSTTTFTLRDQSSANGAPAVDSTTSVIDIDPAAAPTIAGTGSGLTTTSETPIRPFAHATIGDANSGASDTLTITLAGSGGTLADGAGFSGLTNAGAGVYRLSGTASAITSELDALVFTPKPGAPNTSSTTTFTLSDVSSAGGAPAVDSTTTVIDKDVGISLVEIANRYFALYNANGTGPLLEYGNAPVTAGEFGAWVPIGAAALSDGGYEVAWRNGSTGLFTVWDTDANGNYVSDPIGAVAVNNPALEQLETTFHQDLNGDGAVGVAGWPQQSIQTGGEVSLVEIGNRYFALDKRRWTVVGVARKPGHGWPVPGRLGAGRSETDGKWVRGGLQRAHQHARAKPVRGLEHQRQRRLHKQRHAGAVIRESYV